MTDAKDRASGALFGLALGDALGAETEFLGVAEIHRRFGPDGPPAPAGDPAPVTDDTQMALAVGEALLESPRSYAAVTAEAPLRRAFIAWETSAENDRAPGMTCLTACRRLRMGLPWTQSTVADSKGCGANMRVAPVGLVPDTDPETRAALAQFQAALTHDHPAALAASDLTAWTVADLATGGEPRTLPCRAREYARSQRTVYHADWLGALWQRPYATTPAEFIARGWDECLGVLDRLDIALDEADRTADPCLITGEGWIAEEAFATGLLCFLLFPDDPRRRPAPRRRQLRRLRLPRLPHRGLCRRPSRPPSLARRLAGPHRVPEPPGRPRRGLGRRLMLHCPRRQNARLHAVKPGAATVPRSSLAT